MLLRFWWKSSGRYSKPDKDHERPDRISRKLPIGHVPDYLFHTFSGTKAPEFKAQSSR